jgi:protease I
MLLLEKKGVKYTGRNVEVDGKIVTANGPEAAEEFGKAILKLLE